MPICSVCEGTDFDETDGLYFCSLCMTQSQDYRREEADEDNATYDIALGRRIKVANTKPKKTEDLGRPWNTYEGFTIILREQVKALINMGASPKLKDVVFQLWCNYLSKTGKAFPEDETKSKYQDNPRERNPGTVGKPQIISHNRRRRRYAKIALENETLAQALEDEEFYEGDEPQEEEHDVNLDEEVKTLRRGNFYMLPEVITLKKTLVFCYLGMMYTDNLVSASDLVRWVSQNKIPYYRAVSLLPDDMKLYWKDHSTFRSHVVKHENLTTDTEQMIRFLGLSDIPPMSINSVASKFIVMLDLPGELHGFVAGLISSDYDVSRRNMDMTAMGYIVTSLQLLLGLDDTTERELSSIASEMNHIFEGKYTMFVWIDWVRHIGQKISVHNSMNLHEDPRKVRDVQKFLEDFLIFDKGMKCSNSRFKEDRYIRSDTQEALLRPLQIFQSELQKGSAASADDIDLYGEDYNPNLEPTLAENPIDYFLNSENHVEESSSKGDNSENFRKSSFKFITQPLTFQDDLDNIYRSKASVSMSQEESSEGDINLSDVDLFDSPRKKRKLDSSFSLQRSLQKNKEISVEQKEKLSQLLQRLSRLEETSSKATANVARRKKFDDLTFQSKSFQWLVQICAAALCSTPESLNRKVIELQNCLFTDWNPSKIYNKKRLISVYKK